MPTKTRKTAKKRAKSTRSSSTLSNLKHELFCRYLTQNDALFGNATHSYAEAYGYKLDTLSSDDAVYEDKVVDGVTHRMLVQASSYDRAIRVCSVEGARLLRNPRIQARKTELLNELLDDKVVDSQLAKVIMQDGELPAKVAAIREYNSLRNRVKKELEVKHTLIV